MSYTPNVKQTTKDFYALAMEPDYPNEITLQIDRNRSGEGPEVGYSMEAVDELSEQFRAFLLARSYAQYKASGLMPKHVRMKVTMDFSPHTVGLVDDPSVGPFYEIGNDRGITPMDGTLRKHAWRNP